MKIKECSKLNNLLDFEEDDGFNRRYDFPWGLRNGVIEEMRVSRSPDGTEAAVESHRIINSASLETAPVILCAHDNMIKLVEDGTRRYWCADGMYVGIARVVSVEEFGSMNLVWWRPTVIDARNRR